MCFLSFFMSCMISMGDSLSVKKTRTVDEKVVEYEISKENNNSRQFNVTLRSNSATNQLSIPVLSRTTSLKDVELWQNEKQNVICIFFPVKQIQLTRYYFAFYKVSDGGEIIPFNSQTHKREHISPQGEIQSRILTRYNQLSNFVIKFLDKNSPFHDSSLPNIKPIDFSQIHLCDEAKSNLLVKGIMNNKWKFKLVIEVDREAEEVSAKSLKVGKGANPIK